MEIVIAYLESLGVPATIWEYDNGQYSLQFRQGKLLLVNYLKILRRCPHKLLQFLRHSQNLYSCLIWCDQIVIYVGPVIVNISQRYQNSEMPGSHAVMYMPKLLKTVYLEEKQFLQQILVLVRLLELPIDFETISDEFHQARLSRDFDAQLLKLRMSSEGGHVSYLYEREVKKAIAQGNLAALPIIFSKNINSGRIGILADNQDALRNVKNWGIISVSVNLRALFQVGLDYEMVYSLNDQYVRHIESLTSYNEVLAAIEAADVDMAMRCREMVDAKMTAPVSKFFWQLMSNPTMDQSVDDLAMTVGLSSRYLGSQFKKQVGVSISHFKRLVQINHAIEDLIGTNLSMAELAERYGFADQAHFSRVFHALTGITPKEARADATQIADWNLYDYLFKK